MKRITLTRELAHAAGWDAGMASMRKAGRQQWNEDDYNVACETQNRLRPIEYDMGFAPQQPSITS